MTDTSSPPAEPADFIGALRALYDSCNRPSYRRLAETSERLGELYGRHGLPGLSSSGVFEVLAGRRKRPPSSAWVASFVLCCQRLGWEAGIIPSDPGIRTLPDWQARLRAARDVQPADDGTAAAPPVPYPPPETAAGAPVRLTGAQRTAIEDYGDPGRRLLRRAESGDADAVYRIAVLLGTDATRGPEAVALLIEAAADGHTGALDLLDADADGLDHRLAALQAHRLGTAAAASGAHGTALAYYRAAVRGGHLDTAFKITEILRDGQRAR